MAKITWDGTGERKYENGISRGVLYPRNASGVYQTGVAWNGLTSIDQNPEGGEPNELWADNIKYGVLYSTETLGLTINAYTFPDEFMACDGSKEIITGAYIGQQTRMGFGLTYRTEIGSDANPAAGYRLHIVWGCKCSPSDRSYETVNDSPDAMELSWEVTTEPEVVGDGSTYKPSCYIELDSTKVAAAKLTAIENLLYGTDGTGSGTGTDPQLPSIATVISTLTANG